MRRFLDALYDGAGALGAFCVFLIFVLMILAGVGRQMNWHVSGLNDVVAWLCAAAAFLAMAHAFRHGDFVRVTLLLDAVPPRVRRVLDVACLLIASVSVTYLTYAATSFTWESYEFAEMATGLVVIPIWIPQATFVVGCWLLLIAMVDELVGVVRGEKPSYQRAVEERHAAGDFSSEV
ncbi:MULTISPECIES: TRAP transporter small permease [unclassified Variovorax]|jgi:TRAP-type C4-dicarboxylate transport system permease small subunit|uniref:TRAP transporter small permease n=1 Tax=unclassified Variovorax TaxID=663243 RepID=UPI0025788D57|nr:MULTISPECIES: TRAP transporter small permease [unclassified Variovorax]MDM0089358.1 TRAP transporter small permease [Variovorax sp. J22G40]MDM0147430.1 TRAP transporter small permease [Variovorax sp. J2P1-31]